MPTAPDARSGVTVLYYVGGAFAGVPDTDLTANQLARLAWIRLGPSRPSRPDDVKPAAITAIRDELIASGKYSATKSKPKESDRE